MAYHMFLSFQTEKTLIHALNQRASNLGTHQNHLENLLEYTSLSPTPGSLDLMEMGWDLRMCIIARC